MKQQFDEHKNVGESGAVLCRNHRSVSGRKGVWHEKRSEPLFQHLDALDEISERAVAHRHRGSVESAPGSVEAFVNDVHPERKVSQRNRIGSLLGWLVLLFLGLFLGLCLGNQRLAVDLLSRAVWPFFHGSSLGKESEQGPNESLKKVGGATELGFASRIPRRWTYWIDSRKILPGVEPGYRNKTVTTVIFLEILMLTCTIVVDLNTREVLSAEVGDSTTSLQTELLQSAVRGSHFERCLEVDKFALDFWEVDKFALDIWEQADSA